MEMGQVDQAILDLEQAIKLDSSLAVAYANRAFALTIQQKHQEAQRDIDIAVQLGVDRKLLEEKVRELKARNS